MLSIYCVITAMATSIGTSRSFAPLPAFHRPCFAPRSPSFLPFRASSDDPIDKPSSPLPDDQNQSLFGQVADALDFSQVRSQRDAELLQEARSATRSGEKMSREQYGALKRKVGGTYRDFFKDSIDVDGEYVDEGWVDETCRFCKKETTSEPRTIDKFGRYAHIACLEKTNSGNFFTRLFNR